MTAVGGEVTNGSVARQEFNEHYGGYIEIIYLLTQGDFTKFEEVVNWDLHKFLFQGEYLLRKRIIEQMK